MLDSLSFEVRDAAAKAPKNGEILTITEIDGSSRKMRVTRAKSTLPDYVCDLLGCLRVPNTSAWPRIEIEGEWI